MTYVRQAASLALGQAGEDNGLFQPISWDPYASEEGVFDAPSAHDELQTSQVIPEVVPEGLTPLQTTMETPLPPPVLLSNGNGNGNGNGASVTNGNGNGNGAPVTNGNGSALTTQQASMLPFSLTWTHVAIAGAAIGAFLYFRRK